MRLSSFLFFLTLIPLAVCCQKKTAVQNERQVWLAYMDKVSRPVMRSLAEGKLHEQMSLVLSDKIDNKDHRARVAYLEAFGRTFCGIAPWLNTEGGDLQEQKMRAEYRDWTLKGIARAVDPQSSDYMLWKGGQPLVDASFFALGLVRAPWIWEHLDGPVKTQVVEALKLSRGTVPVYSNWILFTGMVECFFARYGYEYDAVRVEYGLREFFEHWYVGDGLFSDGQHFNLDYYNSFVIQPYLSAMLEVFAPKNRVYEAYARKFEKIGQRYAEIQEKMINADGSFPATGRSIVYRSGAFHHLADQSLRKKLPGSLKPQAVRAALGAVIAKTLGAGGTFDKNGWLNIGLYGHQPALAEFYITTGSSYLCAAVFLPLGLSAEDPFWTAPAEEWSAKRIWSGKDQPADHALAL